jgi:hypothetical protein
MQTLLLLLIYVPEEKHSVIGYPLMLFGVPAFDCIVVSMPMLIYIPHLNGNILVLHPLLDKVIEKYG